MTQMNMKKTSSPILFLVLFTILYCEMAVAGSDWPGHYNRYVNFSRQTAMGEFKVCMAIPKVWNRQTWFYFHGAGGNVQSWRTFAENVFSDWHGNTYPRIIGISNGPRWLMVKDVADISCAGSRIFWDTLIPSITENIDHFGETIAIGHSMGGFNGLSLYLDQPEFWDVVLLLSPAIIDLSPFASRNEKIDYVKRTSSNNWYASMKNVLFTPSTDNIEIILNSFQRCTRDNSEWLKIAPLNRLRNQRISPATHFFISCGKNDAYGFMEGSVNTATLLQKAGATVVSCWTDGGHMAIPYTAISNFLQSNR